MGVGITSVSPFWQVLTNGELLGYSQMPNFRHLRATSPRSTYVVYGDVDSQGRDACSVSVRGLNSCSQLELLWRNTSPLPVNQVGESIFVNTSTTPPVTCSKAELGENGQYGKNSHTLSWDSIMPPSAWSLLQRRLHIFKLTATGTCSIHRCPRYTGVGFPNPNKHAQLLKIKKTLSFSFPHLFRTKQKRSPESGLT